MRGDYHFFVAAFQAKHDLDESDIDTQIPVCIEEMGELADELRPSWRRRLGDRLRALVPGLSPRGVDIDDDAMLDEVADVVGTSILIARLAGHDRDYIDSAIAAKWRRNLEKSHRRNPDGKITDDVGRSD